MPAWLRGIRRPWIVADWGSLRALPRDAGLPGTASIMLPDVALKEMLSTERPDAYFEKLNGLIFHPSANRRVVVGRYWNDISNDETTPQSVNPHSIAAAHLPLTRELLAMQRQGRRFVFVQEHDDMEKRKARFLNLVNRFATWMEVEHPDHVRRLRSDPNTVTSSIQGATATMGNLIAMGDPRYATPAWRAAANTFPDRCAAARWMRTIVWYANLRVALPDQSDAKFGNNYEDAHYVFLAQYTGHIWTLDNGMARAALEVSGGRVQVHRNL